MGGQDAKPTGKQNAKLSTFTDLRVMKRYFYSYHLYLSILNLYQGKVICVTLSIVFASCF